jgi:hypothetical protein
MINAEFMVALGHLVQFGGGHSDFVGVSESGAQIFGQGFDIAPSNFVHLDIWLNFILGIALQVTINVV